MRRILSCAALVAVAVLGFARPASSGEIGEIPRDDLVEWLTNFGAPPVTASPVPSVHTVDPIDGQTYDPSRPPFAEARPVEWGSFILTGDELLAQFPDGPATTTTPEWDRLPEATDELVVLFIRTESEIGGGWIPGFNFGFDVDPATSGNDIAGNPKPADCAVDAFLAPEGTALSTSVVDPTTGEFAEAPAPLFLRTFPRGAVFAFPLQHPCGGAKGTAPATYVLVGSQLVEHDVVAPNTPPLPFEPFRITLIGDSPVAEPRAPSAATASANDPKDKDDGGVNPLLIAGGALGIAGLGYGGYRLTPGRRGTNEWVDQDRYGLRTTHSDEPAPVGTPEYTQETDRMFGDALAAMGDDMPSNGEPQDADPQPSAETQAAAPPMPEGMTPRDERDLGDALLGALGETTEMEDRQRVSDERDSEEASEDFRRAIRASERMHARQADTPVGAQPDTAPAVDKPDTTQGDDADSVLKDIDESGSGKFPGIS